MVVAFLDSVIIADWILITKMLAENIKISEKTYKRYRKVIDSYHLLEFIKNKNKETIFFTSQLCVSEVMSVIVDEFKLKVLYEDAVPMKYWYLQKNEIEMGGERIKEISDAISQFLTVFVSSNKIEMSVSLPDYSSFGNTFSAMVDNNLNTHDSILIAEAISNGCSYFVTRDTALIKVRRYNTLQILNPSQFLNSLKIKRDFDFRSLLGRK
jgi:predicted nucleic acid-binding protein